MDYKEKYEQALERCRKLYNEAKANGYTSDIDDYETIFPELKESEDEKTRKALISFLKSPFVNENITDEHVAPWIAWLEKQDSQILANSCKSCKGEQKPAWSEEDKDFLYNTLSNLTELKDLYGKDYGKVGKCIDWLKSLKERIAQ